MPTSPGCGQAAVTAGDSGSGGGGVSQGCKHPTLSAMAIKPTNHGLVCCEVYGSHLSNAVTRESGHTGTLTEVLSPE